MQFLNMRTNRGLSRLDLSQSLRKHHDKTWLQMGIQVLVAIVLGWHGQWLNAEPIVYRVDFAATWSRTTHPTAYPSGGGHFSSLVGGVHSDRTQFWAPGQLASDGIELMAERGGVQLLAGEVQRAITAGDALATVFGSATNSPGSASTTFEVNSDFPFITLVTMIAPSPDWFVGVHDLDLRVGNGWAEQIVVDLWGYDAGTDHGLDFISADIDAVPRQPIRLLGSPFRTSDPALGTFTFTRVTSIPEPMGGPCLALLLLFGRQSLRRFQDGP